MVARMIESIKKQLISRGFENFEFEKKHLLISKTEEAKRSQSIVHSNHYHFPKINGNDYHNESNDYFYQEKIIHSIHCIW